MFVLPQMTGQVLWVLVIALLFTVSTGLVFPCSKNQALFRLMPTEPQARSAVKQLSAEPCTLDWGSAWSLLLPPASCRSESAAGAAGGAGRLPVSETTHDSWIDVVHTAISVGTSAMVFDVTPHGARVEIDTPEHSGDPLQCPQCELHDAGAVARHPVRQHVSWKDSDSDDEANSDSENGAAWFWNVVDKFVLISIITIRCRGSEPPAPMNHVKHLRAGPAEMPFQNWYTDNTNHFCLTDSVSWKSKRQLGSVINIISHNLVRRIRTIKSPGTGF